MANFPIVEAICFRTSAANYTSFNSPIEPKYTINYENTKSACTILCSAFLHNKHSWTFIVKTRQMLLYKYKMKKVKDRLHQQASSLSRNFGNKTFFLYNDQITFDVFTKAYHIQPRRRLIYKYPFNNDITRLRYQIILYNEINSRYLKRRILILWTTPDTNTVLISF